MAKINMPPPDNIYAERTYSSGPYLLKSVPGILSVVFLCLIALRFADGKAQFAGWVGLVGCAVMLAVLLWPTLFKAAPLLTLTAAGLVYRSIAKVVIPWRDIEDIEVRDHSFRYRMNKVSLPDSTVIWLKRNVFDGSVGNQSWFARGPFWYEKLILEDDKIGIVIPPEFVSESPEALHQAIYARWQAFGPRRAPASSIRVPWLALPSVQPAKSNGWLAIKLTLPLIGIAIVLANIAGVWETQQQRSTREMRERWAEERRRDDEERRKRDEQWKKIWDDFDKSFQRMNR